MINLKGITKVYGKGSNAATALSGLNLSIEKGEIFESSATLERGKVH